MKGGREEVKKKRMGPISQRKFYTNPQYIKEIKG